MKNTRNKILLFGIVVVFFAVSSLFLFILNFIPIFLIDDGMKTDFTNEINIESNEYAYVNSSNPDMNYDSHPCVGKTCEIYMNFSLNLLPNKRTELYFFIIHFFSLDYQPIEDLEINIILITSKWNSSEITWNNKPEHEEIIDTVNITNIVQYFYIKRYDLERAVNLTKFYNYNYPEEISFCVNITLNNENLDTDVYIAPGLLWNYEDLLLSYTTIITTPILILFLIGSFFFLRKTSYEENRKEYYRLGLCIFWTLALITLLPFFTALFLALSHIWYHSITESPLIIGIVNINWVIICSLQLKRNITKYRELR